MGLQRLAGRVMGAGLAGLLLLVSLGLGQPAMAQEGQPAAPGEFDAMVPQGFGDRQNTYAWSMAWWRGKLYVGTGRSTQCVQQATGTLFYPTLVSYPPQDDDVACTPSPQDLSLRAEIWRWTPETDSWDRVYVSPNDVPIADFPGKTVARDIGFRTMLVFTEADGSEALYVGGVSSNSFNPGVPPPRILRTTDGINFQPVPQQPGTFLGDTKMTSFRSMVSYQGRMFVIGTEGYGGFGQIFEAANPAGGNDNFRLAFEEDLTAFQLGTYNGYLMIGTGKNILAYPPDLDVPPFQVLKSDTSGDPPYDTTVVIPDGGYRTTRASRSVVSMHEFKGQYYVGTDRPAELYRINPDDTWDLMAGTARWTPIGIKYPLSGMDVGFDNQNNIHIWRMVTHGNQMYVGTMDQSTKWRAVPVLGERLAPEMGFDLYSTTNGQDYVLITKTGFGDMFDVGIRNFASTPHGLVLGTANQYYGTKLYRQIPVPVGGGEELPFSTYLPLLNRGGGAANPARAGEPMPEPPKDFPLDLSYDWPVD
jgi:hypothetical protein